MRFEAAQLSPLGFGDGGVEEGVPTYYDSQRSVAQVLTITKNYESEEFFKGPGSTSIFGYWASPVWLAAILRTFVAELSRRTDKGVLEHNTINIALGRCTGIDGYNSAGDIACLITEQVLDRIRHILDLGEPAQRAPPHDLFSLLVGKSVCHFGC